MSDQRSASERLAESWLSEADVAELKADAWEEGYTCACLDDKHGRHPGPNPYRFVAVDRPRPKCGHSPGHEAGDCQPTSDSYWATHRLEWLSLAQHKQWAVNHETPEPCEPTCTWLTPCSPNCEDAHGWLMASGRYGVGPIEPGERP